MRLRGGAGRWPAGSRRCLQLLRRLDAATVRLVLTAFDHAAAGVGRRWRCTRSAGTRTQLVQRTAEPLPWPVDELDQLDRPRGHGATRGQRECVR